MTDFLKDALALHERGYSVLPVKPSLKRVVIEGWSTLEPSVEDIKGWAKSGYKKGNIGINTRHTPAVDIDVYDKAVAQHMEDWVVEQFGETCVRVGRAPKRLLVFRTDEPFRKMSAAYTDGKTEHKVEILGAGQQFVAYGVHPDTKKPYTWTSFDDPLNTDRDSLPSLSREQAEQILEHFCDHCEALGWESLHKHSGSELSGLDGLESYRPICNVSGETIRETLDLIPNKDADYDDYMEVGFALHHQFQQSDEGLQLWHEWAERSSKYDPTDLNRRWDSFGDGPGTVTFASLLRKAKMIREEAADRAFEKALNRVNSTNDKRVLTGELVKELARAAQNDVQLDSAINKVQERLGELDNTAKPRKESVRKMFAAALPKQAPKDVDVPRWCENWVYVQQENNFYHTITGRRVSAAAFDRTYNRELISKANRERGESFNGKASDAALNLYCIPTVYDYLYFPGADDFFALDGNPVVNTWNRNKIPGAHPPKSAADRKAVRMFEKHLELLIEDETERRLLLDYLAYNVQYPAERVHWTPVLQGVEGGGKSFFQTLMSVVIGESNVGLATAGDLHEQYTAWAEGSKMVFFEEVKINGLAQYEIVNKLKPYITNATVTIRRMQRNTYKIPNMTNYFMFTNYLDAIPLEINDRRYFIVRTTFLTRSHIDDFVAKHPKYFDELFEMLGAHAPVLRWYLETHELSDAFRPKSQAPRTTAWQLMYDEVNGTETSSGDEGDELSELLNADDPLLTDEVLSAARLRDRSPSFGSLAPRAFSHALSKAGFALVAITALGSGDSRKKDRFYTRHSGLYVGHQGTITERIRELSKWVDDGFD